MYAVGSLAHGGFDPRHSDIDIVVVTEGDIGEDLFRGLQAIHARFSASESPWAARVEAVYVPENALRRPIPDSAVYPQTERETALFCAVLENGWVFQCYTLREHGLILAGPDPRTLMDPIKPQDMHSAVATIAGLWLEQAQHDPDWLDWVRQRKHQVFVILTLCRMLYSLATGAVVSKFSAAQWAKTALDQRWTTLITSSLAQPPDELEILPSELDDTLAFIQYTLEQSQPEHFSSSC
jgi:hypothetical protein